MPETGARKWIITFTLVFSAMMELIDATVVNVAMPHMMGNLGISFDDIGWAVTAYSMAIILILPISGWLGKRFGRKNYYMASIIIFTIASFFCGSANSLEALIFFRFIQGLAGGGLSPTSQAILIETWPKKELGMAMAMFGMGVVLGPIIGPVLGGYITDHFSWRWCFYINIPLCMMTLFMVSTFIKPTPREKYKKVDWIGLLLLVITVFSSQIVLERGEKADWFDSTYIIILTFTAIISLIVFIMHELKVKFPIVNLRVFRHRSFSLGMATTFLFGLGMFGTVFVYPLMFQNLLGFTAEQTGLVTIPSAIVTVFMMPIIGNLMKRNIPTQLIACTGILIFMAFCMMMQKTTMAYGMNTFIFPLMIRGFGLSFLFVPITTLAVQDLKGDEIGEGTGMNTMMRQLGNAFGVALITTFVDHRVAYHKHILSANITNYNPAFLTQLKGMVAKFMGMGNSHQQAYHMAMKATEGQVLQQSYLLSYTDVFWVVGMFFIILIPLMLFQRFKPQED